MYIFQLVSNMDIIIKTVFRCGANKTWSVNNVKVISVEILSWATVYNLRLRRTSKTQDVPIRRNTIPAKPIRSWFSELNYIVTR